MIEKDEVKKDIGRYKSIAAILNQEGGVMILKTLKKEVADDIESIMSLVSAPEIELRSKVAKLKADLGVLRIFTRSKSNLKMAMEALEAIDKELEETK